MTDLTLIKETEHLRDQACRPRWEDRPAGFSGTSVVAKDCEGVTVNPAGGRALITETEPVERERKVGREID